MKKGKSLGGEVENTNPKSKGKDREQVRKDTSYTNLQTQARTNQKRGGKYDEVSPHLNMQNLKLVFH